ncbi:MAG: ClpXP protease specificity-enhancing factor [Burkholderiaceae bacterium]
MNGTSTKPYLLRAIYEWCRDLGYTPYLSVVVDEHTLVPAEHVVNGEIVLNVSPAATNGLSMGNELIEFQARFGGVARQLSVPVANVSAIYARENGHGMAFEVAIGPLPTTAPGADGAGADDADTRPMLSAVPSPESGDDDAGAVDGDEGDGHSDGPDDRPPPVRRRPRLKRVK